jgi:hypothetical protein|tara:strand:+ start:719 stop:2140 length:1422 start_codon:yes stop_codon:yes gene_type:complete
MTSPIKSFYEECRYIIDSIGNPDAKRIRETIEKLNRLQRLTKYQLRSLQIKKTAHWQDLWRTILKDTEQLRKNGQADLALEVLNGAKASGLTNPWTEASRAKTYEKLSQWPQALKIWAELKICKNKDVSRIAIKKLNSHASKINTFTFDLVTIIQDSGNKTRFLPKVTPTCLQELEDPILAEVAVLQESKSLELSAKILKKSIAAGLSTPRIREKLASLLCALERNNEAIVLWQSLLSSKNITVKSNAEKMLKRMSEKFLKQLRTIITNTGQPILHLPEIAPSTLSKLESAIIKEADALRNAKSSNCSLEILQTSIKWGVDTDMIKAKKARTLLSMKKNTKAVILLTSLLTSNSKKAKQIAHNLLARHPKEAEKAKIDLKLKKLFNKIKNDKAATKKAIEMLTDEILNDPKNEQLHRALQEIAAKQLILNAPKVRFFEELTQYNQERAGLEVFLEVIEKRYKSTTELDEKIST